MNKLLFCALAALALHACSHGGTSAPASSAPEQAAGKTRTSPCNDLFVKEAPQDAAASDANQDGVMSYDEYFCAANARFNELNKDDDAHLSAGEQKNLGSWKKKADQTKDKKVSVVEYLWSAEQAFKAADKNKDGVLSRDESNKTMP